MGAELLPQQLDDVTLYVEAAFGADAGAPDMSGWEWTDITSDVRYSDRLTTKTGRSDESSKPQPAECSMVLDNTHGHYSRNVRSKYYPNVRKNVPIRVRLDGFAQAVEFPGDNDSYIYLEHTSDIDLQDTLDIRAEIDADITVDTGQAIAHHAGPEVDDIGWVFLFGDSQLSAYFATSTITDSDMAASDTINRNGRMAIRMVMSHDGDTLNVDFYIADHIDGEWESVGGDSFDVDSDDTINTPDAPLELGISGTDDSIFYENFDAFSGDLYRFEVRDDDDIVAGVDMSDYGIGDSSIDGLQGHTWHVHGNIHAPFTPLFVGYATEWTPSWDTSTNNATVALDAHGVWRRLTQHDQSLPSTLRRELSQRDTTVAYWPWEDGKRARRFSSAIEGVSPMTIGGEIEPGKNEIIESSRDLPKLGEDPRSSGTVPAYEVDYTTHVMFLLDVEDDDLEDDDLMIFLATTDSDVLHSFYVYLTDKEDPKLKLNVHSVPDITDVDISETTDDSVRGKTLIVDIRAKMHDGDVDITMSTYAERGHDATDGRGDTASAPSVPAFRTVYVGGNFSGDFDHVTIGHIAVLNEPEHGTVFTDIMGDALSAFAGETATDRMQRLCKNAGVPLAIRGSSDIAMGPQRVEKFTDLLQQCAAADHGILHDGIDIGLTYVSRDARTSIEPSVTIDGGNNEILPDLEPTDDDKNTVNDQTVTQTDGEDAQVTLESGPMGIRTIGRYDDDTELNIDMGKRAKIHAEWLLAIGTVDGYRFPEVNDAVHVNPDHADGWATMRPGGRLDITDPQSTFEQFDEPAIQLAVQQVSHTIDPKRWNIATQCSPYEPWRVAIVGDSRGDDTTGVARLDTVDSHTDGDADNGDTELTVVTDTGPSWTTDSDSLPFRVVIGGIIVTVTEVDGDDSPQTFTVEPIHTGIPDGADVRVYHPARVGM